jgi:hypothetical protein
MSLPTLTTRIGFASNPFDNPQTWTDVSSDSFAFHIAGGRQHALARIEAGTAQVSLWNHSGQYWKDNAAGPYYGNIKPGKCINLRAVWDGTTYDLYTGFIKAWPPKWADDASIVSYLQLGCIDLIGKLSRHEITDGTGYSAELSGTRIGHVLDSLGFPAALRDIDAGQSTMQATGALVDANAMDHLHQVQESERGQFFIAGDGKATFHDRHARFNSPFTTSQAIFDEDAGENSFQIIELSLDDEFIYNTVTRGRTGGTPQTATDSTSQTAYGKSSLPAKTDLLMATDADALSQAQYLISQYKDAVLRSKKMVIYPQRDPVNLWPKVLGCGIGTRITLRLNQASLDKDYHIESYTHDEDARDGHWVTTWQLSDADAQSYWTLGVAGLSELGETTKLCY